MSRILAAAVLAQAVLIGGFIAASEPTLPTTESLALASHQEIGQ